jgi:chemotaxis signal transduction protein
MLTNTILNKWSETIEMIVPTIELIVFDIGDVSFGIPITKIDRIISNVHLDQDYTLTQNVEIVDLHDQLTGMAISSPTAIAIFTNAAQQLAGIPIDTVPILVTVPLDRIRIIPSEFRATNPLGIASHIAIISDPGTELTIFILEN